MRIQINSGTIDTGVLFKLVWRGWFYGVLVIFLPIFAIAALASLASGGKDALIGILSVFFVPLIAAMQGVLAGGLVLLGLKVRPPKPSDATPPS